MATFWSLLFTFLSSTVSKYLFTIILILMVVFGFYMAHLKRIELEKQKALYEYNLNQLEQAVKDQQKHIKDLETINKDKEVIVIDLIRKKEELENKLKDVESEIDIAIGKGEDKPSSSILKNLFKKLGNGQ